ncbi:MAG: penicillin-binding protein 2 [Patescibacteria group bacterium]
MKRDPFIIKEAGGDIRDRGLAGGELFVDGDILVAESYRKHPRHSWAKFQNNSVLFYAAVLFFILLLGRLYYLQILRGEEYFGVAENNRIRATTIAAPRGVIFDRAGERLAYNVPDFGLFVVPGDLPKKQEEEDKIFNELTAVVKTDHFDLVELFAKVPRTSYQSVELMRGLTQEQAVVLEGKAKDWQGISVRPIERRAYQERESLAHILGYTGKIAKEEYEQLKGEGYELNEYVGKIGIEKTYEPLLHGRPGAALEEVDSLGKEIKAIDRQAPVPGYNVYLNIDNGLQALAWRELEAVVKRLKTPGGSVVALDPRSGAVLALVSYPGFDNELFGRGIDSASYQALLDDPHRPLYNRAVSGEYPSGSTFKIIVGAAALEEGVANANLTVLSQGGLNVNGYIFPDWKAGGHGLTNITKALAESVNTYFYTIGGGYGNIPGLGVEKIVDYGKKFGLTALSGIDLPAERAGFLPSKEWKLKAKGERWFLGDTYHLAIGQGDILVTPLQVANYTAIIANGGTLYKPQMVDRMDLPDGTSHIVKPEIIRQNVVSSETVQLIAAGMRAAVTAGSAQSLGSLPQAVTGKTGTAEYGESGAPHAWFTGFGPYEHPEIVITVLVEAGEGGNISATPIAKKMFEYYFNEKKNKLD